MSRFTTPKVFASNEPVLKSADLNAITAAIAASLNGITNEQVASWAAIQGTKLLDNTLTSTKFNDRAVDQAALAVNSMTYGVDSDQANSISHVVTLAWEVLATVGLTVAGGPVLLLGDFGGYFGHVGVGFGAVEARLSRTGYGVITTVLEQESTMVAANAQRPMCLAIVGVDRSLSAGAYTWTLDVRCSSTYNVPVVRSFQLFAVELR